MTNEEAKQEAIKKAFGKSWNMLTYSMQEHILTRHHWVDRSSNRMNKSPNNLNFDEQTECEPHCEFWRPIQLKGIEDNNGWIRIEPDGSNLPETGSYKFYCERNSRDDGKDQYIFQNPKNNEQFLGLFTHYKIIQKELLPVY